MKTPLKKVLKWVLRFSLLFITLVVFYLLILAYPQVLFAYKLQHNNYIVYSDEKIPRNFVETLDDIENSISVLEIYDTAFSPKIFLSNGKKLYGFFAFLSRVPRNSQGFNLSLFDNTFINKQLIKRINVFYNRQLKYTNYY